MHNETRVQSVPSKTLPVDNKTQKLKANLVNIETFRFHPTWHSLYVVFTAGTFSPCLIKDRGNFMTESNEGSSFERLMTKRTFKWCA